MILVTTTYILNWSVEVRKQTKPIRVERNNHSPEWSTIRYEELARKYGLE